MTEVVLNITGFINQKNLDIMGWPYTRSNLVLVYVMIVWTIAPFNIFVLEYYPYSKF